MPKLLGFYALKGPRVIYLKACFALDQDWTVIAEYCLN